MQQVEAFFADIDQRWDPRASTPIVLHILGTAALMLQSRYERLTDDADVLHLLSLDAENVDRLIALAGKKTLLHARHAMYLDIVANGLPFLPHVPCWHQLPVRLENFELRALDVVDVVVSKLMPFRAKDRADIRAMVELGLVPHPVLVERFRDAFDHARADASAERLPRCVENMNQIERDLFDVSETNFDEELGDLRF